MPSRMCSIRRRNLKHRRLKQGFTLVELLVVVAIIGALVAMLFPAVQAARETARRASCMNNLKQIGVALHLYHDTGRQLPAAWTATHPITGQAYWLGQPGWAWAGTILPYLEQTNVVQSRIHWELRITDPLNDVARVTSIETYRCPTDIGGKTFVLPPGLMPSPNYNPDFTATELATANYVGVFGTAPMSQVCGGSGDCVGDGSLVFARGMRLAEFRDGLSQTFVVGERRSESYPSTWVGVLAGGAHAPGRVVAVASTPPNSAPGSMFNFSSFHPKGTNFLAADGSVHLVSESIAVPIYLALCTRAGGEFVGDFLSP